MRARGVARRTSLIVSVASTPVMLQGPADLATGRQDGARLQNAERGALDVAPRDAIIGRRGLVLGSRQAFPPGLVTVHPAVGRREQRLVRGAVVREHCRADADPQ